jgi:4-hydroxybenzoate polyprenyltransferase
MSSLSLLIGLVRLARPKHWIKNVFVLLPVPFAIAAGLRLKDATHVGIHFDVASFLFGLAGFCLINSTIYVLNDLFDAKADAHHPQKRRRPIPSGQVPVGAAAIEAVALCAAGMLLCKASGQSGTIAVVITYFGINIAYNLGAKHISLLDVFLLASGFILRVLLGCVLVSAAPSAWLLLCTSSLALFLGFAKRRADLKEGLDHTHRPSLRGYSLSFLDHAMIICAGTAILSYALYSIEAKILLPGREMASMPFVVYGILNYLRMVDVKNVGGNPVEVALRSIPTQICGLGWIIAVTWSLGLW